jgi:hypothetical protein
MPTPSRTPEQHLETFALFEKYGTSAAVAAAVGGKPVSWRTRLQAARAWQSAAGLAQPVTPRAAPLPPSDIPVEQLIDLQCRRFTAADEHRRAKLWRRFTVPTAGPYALMLFGDPHVDDNGCNWPLLRRHCELARTTEHLYAVSVGDVTNNWTGRLAKLWAEQDTSAATARKFARWLMVDSGVPWFLWVHGNHDAWDGPVSSGLLEGMNCHEIAMEDWQAKVTLASPSGHELRLWVAHNFKGHSQWNKLHGAQKAAQMEDWAHLYVAGHHHNWALHEEEHDHRRFTYWLARTRGYKFHDHYADVHGFGSQDNGASILAVIDPTAAKINAVKCFSDPFEGVEFLQWKRAKAAA